MSSFDVPNYFTCTLGETTTRVLDKPDLQTINDFIDYQARTHPKDHAVGFPSPAGKDKWSYELLSFEDLRNGSKAVAAEFAPIVARNPRDSSPECVALLCPSSIDFLFTWLGLMRAGLSVLLIAPQCQPSAVAHLCQSCDVTALFHSKSYADLARKSVSEKKSKLLAIELPWKDEKCLLSLIRNSMSPREAQRGRKGDSLDPAYIFHTSGTSTGLPKPIIQTHHAAFRVLPMLDGRQSASFTTTPLYHGGIADCLRAWTSNALIWLFPAADVPITAQNIGSCISVAKKAAIERSSAEVKYFSSVPYVLEMLADDPSGMSMLQSMEVVGVGGAALSLTVGDSLVQQGINLISRYGSAECGFLLSSSRDYDKDKHWNFLRHSNKSEFLQFEKLEDDSGLYELIVKQGWPHMSKINRQDGSFGTNDLFQPHSTIERAWKYHSRADGQITLSTGKKFDPEPLENLISSSSPLIQEVLVFGSGRQTAGILIFLTKEGLEMDDDEIWKVIEAANLKGPAYSRISQEAIMVMTANAPKLPRSSKGTILRGAAEKLFEGDINEACQEEDLRDDGISGDQPVEGDDIHAIVSSVVKDILGGDETLKGDTNFYAHGVDSATCTRIRSLLQKRLGQGSESLPWNVVYDCGDINTLSSFISEFQEGTTASQPNEEAEMCKLIARFSKFNPAKQNLTDSQLGEDAPCIIVVTGTTGALGAHILDLLRADPKVTQIICLVRAVDHFTARSRVSASLLKRKKSPLGISDQKVWCTPCKLSDPDLGISKMELSHIRESVTHIIHAAWAVNFSMPLKSFVDEHILGLYNLLNVSISCSLAVHFTFCSSTASVIGCNTPSTVEEKISNTPSDPGVTGYSRSKWVAEGICASAAKSMLGTVNVLRIGQLTGDTSNGVWNISEAWPLMLTTVDAIDCLPKLGESLSWLPLDTAATAVMEITFQSGFQAKQAYVYHVVNNSTDTKWSDLLLWSAEARSKSFEVVSPSLWLERLEHYPKPHPAKNLLGLWKAAYCADESTDKAMKITKFSVAKTEKKSSAIRNVLPVDEVLVKKIWSWLEDEIKAARTQVYVSRNRFDSI